MRQACGLTPPSVVASATQAAPEPRSLTVVYLLLHDNSSRRGFTEICNTQVIFTVCVCVRVCTCQCVFAPAYLDQVSVCTCMSFCVSAGGVLCAAYGCVCMCLTVD